MRWMLVTTVEKLPDPAKPETWPAPTSEEESDFYAHLGATVATWQFVEAESFEIFAEIFRHQEPILSFPRERSLSAAFFSVPSFRGRLNMIDSVIDRSGLAANDKAKWATIEKKAIKRSNRRNILAHSLVVFEAELPAGTTRLYSRPNMSDASRSEAPAFPTQQRDKIGVKELVEMMNSFESLRLEMTQFRMNLMDARTQPVSPG